MMTLDTYEIKDEVMDSGDIKQWIELGIQIGTNATASTILKALFENVEPKDIYDLLTGLMDESAAELETKGNKRTIN